MIGTASYQDDVFTTLPSVRADVHYLSQVLEMPSVGRFEPCVRVEDSSKAAIKQSVESFLRDREPDELVVLYISGHGLYDTEDGQLYYITADTRADQLQRTAMEAAFITEQLEACAARRKILLLDCCFSGAAVQGFRSKGGPRERSMSAVEASGVYVITASHQWEAAFESSSGEPSQFTRAMVQGLHSGRADLDGDGKVSADDLFRHISRELKNAPDGKQQTPTKSSLQVTGDIFLANSAVGRQVPALKPLAAAPAMAEQGAGGAPALPSVKAAVAAYDDTAFTDADWPKLFKYYLQCLREENSTDQLLPLVGGDPPRAVWPAGEEVLLSGSAGSVPAPSGVVELAARARQDGADLWYGYPVVVLFDGKRQVCAPLVMQQIEVAQDQQGRPTVVPAGPVVPHPKLILDRLGKDEGVELLASYQPNWRPGFREEMVRDLRSLLGQLGLADTEHLDPAALGDGASLPAAHEGARNVALVHATRGDSGTSAQLVKDYSSMQKAVGQIAETALGAFARPFERDEQAERAVQVVAPLELNDGQETVIRAAMTRRLTVATGPPGTGKSQLIVNAVATARAAGQSVLVASTNNKAVDEVWERCEELVPGLLVRTGSRGGERDNVEDELRSLEQLARGTKSPRTSEALRGELRNNMREQLAARQQLADVALRERQLADLGGRRHEYADQQHCDVGALTTALGDDAALDRWLPTARRASRARLFGGRRRVRALRRLRALAIRARDPEEFSALVRFAEDEAAWRAQAAIADREVDDAQLLGRLRDADRKVRDTAAALLQAVVPEHAAPAREAIRERIQAVRARAPREWAALDNILPNVPCWAVTARSARRFRDRPAMFDLVIVDEASQCSTLDVLPLLFRARRALVIGDPMQLPHITKLQPRQEAAARDAAAVRGSWLEEHRLGHRRYSSFHAAARAAGATLLLGEHYRCHPDVVGISNRYCYAGRLTVLTDPKSLRRLDGVDAVQWLDVTGTARQGRDGSWINGEEAERVHIAVERLLRRMPDGSTVGVVTPFRAQKDLIARRWKSEPRVRVGTVHTFQGGQQDVMLLSLVAGPHIRPSALNWLCREVNLWNVAITRARSHLIVLGDQGFWSNHSGVPRALLEAAAKDDGAGSSHAVHDEQHTRLGDRFQKLLTDAVPGLLLDRGTVTDGYPHDFDIQFNGMRTQVLLDHGVVPDADAARHLRLALTRAALLPRGVRVPAWHVWAGRTNQAMPMQTDRRMPAAPVPTWLHQRPSGDG
ncbi:caspase, EACC1-associated type [Streptantibioticus ferralitis]|uniref:AAA domain-containing protein n=1 Tax=Streptantibioticus ferralitis TaxID=236510 RepID=A0ABT5YVH1_9ACTN|nr:AAA domain-containing protein [Streptantibioticus ferralitis]MDF2255530.1 AAA domain-containing protein [Streptantibioticus ferralitis]